ncbi:MAG TPA: lytic transglycosylase domain-containing protein, partial [Caulobacteraceae bacterium]
VGACAAAMAVVLCGSAQAQVRALSDRDAAVYAAAFRAASQGDFDAAERDSAVATDKSLVGYLQFQKLTWRGARATYDELKGWLAKYADLPVADRILQLAKKKRPDGDPDLKTPSGATAVTQSDFLPASSGQGLAARQAYYLGDVRTAYRLAQASGERWIAGLAAFRMQEFDSAVENFRAVAIDPASNDWLRSGAAYWAARAAIAAGTPEMAPDFLAIATRTPWTFYGILAERQLGLEAGADPDAYVLAQAGLAPAPPSANDGEFIKAAYASVSEPELMRLIEADPRARRAVALAQIGRATEAGAELRTGLLAADSEAERDLWTTLALQLNSEAVSQSRTHRYSGFDPDDFPTPDLQPDGGFVLDKALVFAVVRQESRFNAYAVSGKGAMGLMQVTPATAVTSTGDSSISPLELFDAATNLKIGQATLNHFISGPAGGDMLRGLAAYDSGPGGLQKAVTRVGDSDPLMLMESLPYGETRAYVEKVMANYWIYRRMFGEHVRSIDALASGQNRVGPEMDR